MTVIVMVSRDLILTLENQVIAYASDQVSKTIETWYLQILLIGQMDKVTLGPRNCICYFHAIVSSQQ